MNEQETFWSGEFGEEYIERNRGKEFVAARVDWLSKCLRNASRSKTVIELGANWGPNAVALKALFPDSEYTGVEIGEKAFSLLSENPCVDHCHHSSIHSFQTDEKYDLAMIAGVMIHINPDQLIQVYRLLSKLTTRYVLISEYYNPTPITVDYRGNQGQLFKRDFAGEFIAETRFRLVDYGFVYHGDPKYRHNDTTWFLLECAERRG
jgi:pseudaminic acid biosynthesis-associated methylase